MTAKQIDTLQEWRAQMIDECMAMVPDHLSDDERAAYRAGLSTGWRETINTLRLQGMISE